MFDTALEYEELGLKVVPFDVQLDSCNTPVKWREKFQTATGWKNYFEKVNGIGVILGKDSGHVSVIDVDQKHDVKATLSNDFLHRLKHSNLSDIDFYIEETRSGGLHIWFKRLNRTDAKLFPARTIEENGKPAALIEVLGEGQLVFSYPTKGYSIMHGAIDEIPLITEDQYIDLILLCESFNELPADDYVDDEPNDIDPNDQRVGSIYNRECDPIKFVSYLVTEHDWKVHKKVGDKYWLTRPGKEQGVSATFNHDGRKMLMIFSSSVEGLPSMRNGKMIGHTPFKVLTELEYGGNYSAATAALMNAGFVSLEDWPEIERIDRRRPKPIDLDELLPDGDFKEYVRQLAHWVQCPPDLVVLPALTIVSIALCGMTKIDLGEDWLEIPPIWSICIAPPSERKSPVINALCKPFKTWSIERTKILNPVIKRRDRKCERIKTRIEKCNKEYDKAMKDPTKGAVEMDELELTIEHLEEMYDEVKDPIGSPDLIHSDITPEALVIIMAKNGDVVGLVSAENEPLDIALGHYGDKPNLAVYLKGYSGDPYKQTRKHSETVSVEECKLAMTVLVQPDAVKKLLENKAAQERGMIARFLYMYPKSKLGTRELKPGAPSANMKRKYSEFIHKLLNTPHHKYPILNEKGDLTRCEEECEPVGLTDGADDLFMELRARNEFDLTEGGRLDDTFGFGGKLCGNIARIALAIHWIQGGKGRVSQSTMKYAINWSEVLIEHFFYANGYHSDNPVDRRVLKCIRSLKGKDLKDKTLRDVYTILKTEKYQKTEDWDDVFNRMTVLGYMRVKEEKTAGRPKKLVYFNPKLWEVYYD